MNTEIVMNIISQRKMTIRGGGMIIVKRDKKL